MNCMAPLARRRRNEPDRADQDGASRGSKRTALAGDAGHFRGYGTSSGKRDAQLRAIFTRTGRAGMRTAAWQSYSQAAARFGLTFGEVAGQFRSEAPADEGEPAVEGVAGRRLLRSQGELVGFWESGSGQEPLALCDRTGVNLNASPKNQVHDLRTPGPRSADRETGTAIAPGDQKAG